MAVKDKVSPREPSTLSHEALTMATAILVERIKSLPQNDRQDLFELVKELARADSCEEIESIASAMREIIEQAPIRIRRMEQPVSESQPGPRLQKWIDFVSSRIRMLRTKAGMTQAALAEKCGLPQSHISRLEGGKHSPSRATIERIADALGQPVSAFDPSD